MPDYEKLIDDCEERSEAELPDKKRKSRRRQRVRDRDDLSGMFLHMGKKVDVRELFIVWVIFLFLHTEMFAEHFLKRVQGATNEDLSMTMKGTLCASLLMIMVVMICAIAF